MNALYRQYAIQITRAPTTAYFIVLRPNGAKFFSGHFSLTESLRAKYQELKNQIDAELANEPNETTSVHQQ
jgi:hypothetical protein